MKLLFGQESLLETVLAIAGVSVGVLGIMASGLFASRGLRERIRSLPILGRSLRKIIEPPLPPSARYEILPMLEDDDFADTVKEYAHTSSPSLRNLRRALTRTKTNSKTEIILSELFLTTLRDKKISPTSAVAMILNELGAHASLLEMDFSGLPVPLRSGLVVILGKQNERIEVGGIEVFEIPKDLDRLWQECIRKYLKCRNLPHRQALTKESMEKTLADDFQLGFAFSKCMELVSAIDEYVLSLEKNSKERDLRIGMSEAILDLSKSYQNIMRGAANAKFSDFIIATEMVTSFSHKIVLGDRSIVID